MGSMISVATLDGEASFAAYRAEPAGEPKGAIVVIQEIFGLTPGIRAKCDTWAAEGYLALAPDMFWRIQPGLDLDPDVPEQMQEAFGFFQKFDFDEGIKDVEATIRAARAAVAGRKVGLVGFCMGGRMAYLAATRTDVDASVGYYAVGLPALLRESHAIGRPLLLHIAKDDAHVPPDQQAAIHAGLDDNPHVTIVDWDGVDHGFATETGKRRNDAVARQADARTKAFFAEHIG